MMRTRSQKILSTRAEAVKMDLDFTLTLADTAQHTKTLTKMEENEESPPRQDEEEKPMIDSTTSAIYEKVGDDNFFEVTQQSSPFEFCHPTHARLYFPKSGRDFHWNARRHRKLRHLQEVTDTATGEGRKSPRFLSWEPHIVTWWNVWIGFVANTLWVVNGIYCTFPPAGTSDDDAVNIMFATGVVGAFMFIVTAYLGIVEVLNHNHMPIKKPPDEQKLTKRKVSRLSKMYGHHIHPLQQHHESPLGAAYHEGKEEMTQRTTNLRQGGFPIVLVPETKEFITHQHDSMKNMPDSTSTASNMDGDYIDIIFGNQIIHAQVKSVEILKKENTNASTSSYRWWTWHPDFKHISVFSAYLFQVCTIVFFIPACLQKADLSFGVDIFFNYTLQIVPSIGFMACGYFTIIESSGKCLSLNMNVGYWVGLLNALGGLGFFLCPILLLPGYVNDWECCDELTKWGGCFSTFLGSCFFWIAGVLECIEFATAHPIW